ncbi:MAG: class I SAM-dependent methyltransferase [Actinobacteria bacterium]|nr:class I SAM-dependent methyltransferase [Actinomycetota bacterium]
MKTVTNLSSEVYYQGQYWNNIPQVLRYICKKFTGDENKWWIEDFRERYAVQPFKHGLFLNCGDGRWEREFIDKNIVESATAFDISPDLLKKADSLKEKRSINYILADANKIRFKKSSFDLVVNIAALHHVQYINRLCEILLLSLKSDGYLVSFDYIGPYRNQYSFINWLLIKIINNSLSENIRKLNLGYPHLPTMLKQDPTEAIHSNLILKTIYRFFDIIERNDAGGGIAYTIFTHNPKLLDEKVLDLPQTRLDINQVLKLDHALSKLRIIPNFFSYLIAKPKKDLQIQIKKSKYFQVIENIREEYSLKLENSYTIKDYLILIKNCRSQRKRVKMALQYISTSPVKFFKILRHFLFRR